MKGSGTARLLREGLQGLGFRVVSHGFIVEGLGFGVWG